MREASERTPAGRLVSLDVFRGMTIAAMLLVNNAGDWSHVFGPLGHAEWHGLTATDLVFPFFLFIMGTAMAFSFARRLEQGHARGDLVPHILRRGAVLVALGLMLNVLAYLALDSDYLRYPGVLQRIGICYIAASLLFLMHRPRGLAVWFVALLVGYWALLRFVPVPGHGAGDLSQAGNLASWLDTRMFGPHCYRFDPQTGAGHDPEGLLSTLPSVATALSGCLAGAWLRTWRKLGISRPEGLAAAGVLLAALGRLWSLSLPWNKNLWTSSYVLYSSGWALIVLALCFWIVDGMRCRRWARPFEVYGLNPIAAYVGASATAYLTILIKVPGADGEPIFLKSWIYQTFYASWIPRVASDYWSSAAYGFTYVVVWCALMWLLYRKKVFLKV